MGEKKWRPEAMQDDGVPHSEVDVIVTEFLHHLPEMLSSLQSAVSARDTRQIEVAAQVLRTAAARVHDLKGTHLAWQIEQMAHGRKLDPLHRFVQDLTDHLSSLASDMRETRESEKESKG